MRVWDQIPPKSLCRQHLLAEHRETLAIWSIITNNKKGYRNHPEVKRWKDNLYALNIRHKLLQEEASNRGYKFKDLPPAWMGGTLYVKPWDNQLETLKCKGCECIV